MCSYPRKTRAPPRQDEIPLRPLIPSVNVENFSSVPVSEPQTDGIAARLQFQDSGTVPQIENLPKLIICYEQWRRCAICAGMPTMPTMCRFIAEARGTKQTDLYQAN